MIIFDFRDFHPASYRRSRAPVILIVASICFLHTGVVYAQDGLLRLSIRAESPKFEEAIREYQAIWESEGPRIVKAMERITSLHFEPGPISVVIYEGPSNSGFRDRPMYLRASYPLATKRATLVHELAHRLISELVPQDFEEHPIIFLFVYDVWVELWGKPFADEQVAVESRRRGLYDYETAWKNTLKLTAEERAARFKQFLIDYPPRKK